MLQPNDMAITSPHSLGANALRLNLTSHLTLSARFFIVPVLLITVKLSIGRPKTPCDVADGHYGYLRNHTKSLYGIWDGFPERKILEAIIVNQLNSDLQNRSSLSTSY